VYKRTTSGTEFETATTRAAEERPKGGRRPEQRTLLTPLWRTYIFYMYNISVCACYYIPLFGSGFCLHCGKVVSQVLPAIKTRAATVATATSTFVLSLVLCDLCASLILYIYKRGGHAYTLRSLLSLLLLLSLMERHLMSKNFDTSTSANTYAPI